MPRYILRLPYAVPLALLMSLAVLVAARAQSPAQQGDMLLQRGTEQLRRNDFPAALGSLQLALSLYGQITAPIGADDQFRVALQGRRSRTMAFIAAAYEGLGNAAGASKFAQQALALGQSINDSMTIRLAGKVLNDLATTAQAPSGTACMNRCQQLPMASAGPFVDCLNRCTGVESHAAQDEEDERQARESRNGIARDMHNGQCQREYELSLQRGADGMSAASRYGRCAQY